ncbi:MAG: BatD family protein, partial [Bradymonadaceae bacterium]
FHVSNRSEEVEKQIQGTRITGRKTVTYTLIPTREGDLTVPSLTFAYFHPDEAKYHTIDSRSRKVSVKGGALPESLRGDGDKKNQKTSDGDGDKEVAAGTDPTVATTPTPSPT